MPSNRTDYTTETFHTQINIPPEVEKSEIKKHGIGSLFRSFATITEKKISQLCESIMRTFHSIVTGANKTLQFTGKIFTIFSPRKSNQNTNPIKDPLNNTVIHTEEKVDLEPINDDKNIHLDPTINKVEDLIDQYDQPKGSTVKSQKFGVKVIQDEFAEIKNRLKNREDDQKTKTNEQTNSLQEEKKDQPIVTEKVDIENPLSPVNYPPTKVETDPRYDAFFNSTYLTPVLHYKKNKNILEDNDLSPYYNTPSPNYTPPLNYTAPKPKPTSQLPCRTPSLTNLLVSGLSARRMHTSHRNNDNDDLFLYDEQEEEQDKSIEKKAEIKNNDDKNDSKAPLLSTNKQPPAPPLLKSENSYEKIRKNIAENKIKNQKKEFVEVKDINSEEIFDKTFERVKAQTSQSTSKEANDK